MTGAELEARLLSAGIAASVKTNEHRDAREDGAFDTLTLHLPDGSITIGAVGENAYDVWLEASNEPASAAPPLVEVTPGKHTDDIPLEQIVAGLPYQADDVNAAYERLRPFLNGYPQPMIDTRRLRIANGTASDADRYDVAVEDALIGSLRRLGFVPIP